MDKNQRPIPMPASLKIEWTKKQATTEQCPSRQEKDTKHCISRLTFCFSCTKCLRQNIALAAIILRSETILTLLLASTI